MLLLGIYPRKMETFIQKHFYKNAHSGFIHNNPKLETTHVSINEWHTCSMAVEWDTIQQKKGRNYDSWIDINGSQKPLPAKSQI